MSYQNIFNYHFNLKNDHENFFVNQTNQKAYDITTLEKFNQNIFLCGPKKSGKSYLANIWKDFNNAIYYNNNFSKINDTKKNVVIDDALGNASDESLFHFYIFSKHK